MKLLLKEFINACIEPSNINEHIPLLYGLAKECNSVTEFGVCDGVSTRAFLYAGTVLTSYDIISNQQVEELFNYATKLGQTVNYIIANDLEIEIKPTDLLFIDSFYTYNQLKKELELHSHKVNKYIVFHDTYTFGIIGEDGGEGLMQAIIEFLDKNIFWRIKYFFLNNNGLLVLENKLCQ